MGDDLRDALPGKAVITREHHDVGCSCGPGAALVGAAKPEIDRIVENTDAGVRDRQRLHPLQGTIGAGVIHQDDLVIVASAHRFAHRPDSCSDVVLLVEAGNDETVCGCSGHAGDYTGSPRCLSDGLIPTWESQSIRCRRGLLSSFDRYSSTARRAPCSIPWASIIRTPCGDSLG